MLILFLLAFFLTPFYFFSSGSLQPSHVFFLLFSFFVLFKFSKYSLESSVFKLFFPFYFYVIFINGFYSLIYQDFSFLHYSAALTLNGLTFLSLIIFLRNSDIKEYFLSNISFYIIILLGFLLFLWAVGLGNYKFSPRYNGFFNDPNQMAFFVLCCGSIGCLFSKKLYQYILLIILSLFLVLLTQSRSGLVGSAFLTFSLFLYYFKLNFKSLFYFFTSIVVFALFIFFKIDDIFSNDYISPLIDRTSGIDVSEQADVRGYTRILNYSEYLFFGAGQGLDYRFGAAGEIHSTWAGFLFYYGIVGLGLFLYIIFSIFFKLNLKEKCLLLAPLMYSFSTFGARTIIFWVLLAFFYYVAFYLNKQKVGYK